MKREVQFIGAGAVPAGAVRAKPAGVPARCLSACLLLLPLVVATPAAGLTVSFSYALDTNRFFLDNPTARATLEKAGQFYSDILTDTLAPITPTGGDTWDIRFEHPSTSQQAYDPGVNPGGLHIIDPSLPADTIRVYVGAKNLPGLAEAGPGTYGASGSAAWETLIETRGQPGIHTGNNADDFAPWGGFLSFDLGQNWNFDHTQFPAGNQNDLYSIALHELAHVLGLGTADSWYSQITGNTFTGPKSTAANNGNAPLIDLQSAGGHWENFTFSHIYNTPTSQEASLDPDILLGRRKLITDLDVAGLDDLGWDVAPPVTGDYDYDGSLDGDDIDELFASFGPSGLYNRARFNLVADNVIDALDADAWITGLANTLPGDTDLDGDVDFEDAQRLLANFTGSADAGEALPWLAGNTDGDHDIDFLDAMTLRRNFAFTAPQLEALALTPDQADALTPGQWADAVQRLADGRVVPEPAVGFFLAAAALVGRRVRLSRVR